MAPARRCSPGPPCCRRHRLQAGSGAVHMWTPDVYQGAPAPAAAFLATVSKGAMFALLLRDSTPIAPQVYHPLFLVFQPMAIASMLAGNLLALLQDNVKRILAYSSIAHLGYLLVAFLAGGASAGMAEPSASAVYFITTLGAFGIISDAFQRRARGGVDRRLPGSVLAASVAGRQLHGDAALTGRHPAHRRVCGQICGRRRRGPAHPSGCWPSLWS